MSIKLYDIGTSVGTCIVMIFVLVFKANIHFSHQKKVLVTSLILMMRKYLL